MSAYQPRCSNGDTPPGDQCPRCGALGVEWDETGCAVCDADPGLREDSSGDGFEPDDGYTEPVGSCDECGCNLYQDDEWDGLCNQCAWYAAQGDA